MEVWSRNVTYVTIELPHIHLAYHIQSVHEEVNNNWNQCDYKATMYVGVYYGTRVDFYFWFSELGFDYDKEVKNFYLFFFFK